MNIEDIKRELVESLTHNLSELADKINTDSTGESVYAVSVYCDSGCTAMGVAYNTVEHLDKVSATASEPRSYFELNAAEWQSVNYEYPVFNALNSRLDDIFEDFYAADLSDQQLADFFVDVIATAIGDAGIDDRVKSRYHGELLLGLQFGDPSDSGLRMIEAVSKRVNVPQWHGKVVNNCAALTS